MERLKIDERQVICDAIVALLFECRPEDGPQGEAWLLGQAARVMARAIVQTVGPTDASELLALADNQVRALVETAQTAMVRAQLTKGLGN